MTKPDYDTLEKSYRAVIAELTWWRKLAGLLEKVNLRLIARSREHARESGQELEKLVGIRREHESITRGPYYERPAEAPSKAQASPLEPGGRNQEL